ncbi:hypothetical protein BCR44DRAFT_1424079, partial [Catenaria anguillulae PL171]
MGSPVLFLCVCLWGPQKYMSRGYCIRVTLFVAAETLRFAIMLAGSNSKDTRIGHGIGRRIQTCPRRHIIVLVATMTERRRLKLAT